MGTSLGECVEALGGAAPLNHPSLSAFRADLFGLESGALASALLAQGLLLVSGTLYSTANSVALRQHLTTALIAPPCPDTLIMESEEPVSMSPTEEADLIQDNLALLSWEGWKEEEKAEEEETEDEEEEATPLIHLLAEEGEEKKKKEQRKAKTAADEIADFLGGLNQDSLDPPAKASLAQILEGPDATKLLLPLF